MLTIVLYGIKYFIFLFLIGIIVSVYIEKLDLFYLVYKMKKIFMRRKVHNHMKICSLIQFEKIVYVDWDNIETCQCSLLYTGKYRILSDTKTYIYEFYDIREKKNVEYFDMELYNIIFEDKETILS